MVLYILFTNILNIIKMAVLILVVVEDGLVLETLEFYNVQLPVLILVIVEDGLVLQNPLFVWAEDNAS